MSGDKCKQAVKVTPLGAHSPQPAVGHKCTQAVKVTLLGVHSSQPVVRHKCKQAEFKVAPLGAHSPQPAVEVKCKRAENVEGAKWEKLKSELAVLLEMKAVETQQEHNTKMAHLEKVAAESSVRDKASVVQEIQRLKDSDIARKKYNLICKIEAQGVTSSIRTVQSIKPKQASGFIKALWPSSNEDPVEIGLEHIAGKFYENLYSK